MKKRKKTHCKEMLEYYTKVMKRGFIETTQGRKDLIQSDVDYYTLRIKECKENIAKEIEDCF